MSKKASDIEIDSPTMIYKQKRISFDLASFTGGIRVGVDSEGLVGRIEFQSLL